MRIIFMGTPDFSVPVLMALIGHGHEIVAVYSQPPRPAGRGMELRKSPVHQKAEEFGIPVFTPGSLKHADEQEVFAGLDADLAVVVAYGLILPPEILQAPDLGAYNVHASVLPRWRGAAPIQRAIMAGDHQSGVAIMKMDEGLDTGPVAMTETVPIGPDMNAGQLHDALSTLGADLMVRAVSALERGTLALTPQPETGVTYADKISKSETRIDWNQPAAAVHDHVRGLSPFPGAWCEIPFVKKTERVKVLATTVTDASGKPGEVLDENLTIACAEGSVRLLQLQRAGKQAADSAAFLRGNTVVPGAVLA
ncbi:MAG: methionyl-tRNA formyltransferase [Pseudomonadota bacterium]